MTGSNEQDRADSTVESGELFRATFEQCCGLSVVVPRQRLADSGVTGWKSRTEIPGLKSPWMMQAPLRTCTSVTNRML